MNIIVRRSDINRRNDTAIFQFANSFYANIFADTATSFVTCIHNGAINLCG